ncbi:MAG TPA: A/G-specific adenine glycosylase [Planctomycetaceae bacterium]|nr:A/G-specific adenine glycosylase [Planctomycetaceae bacterium]
MPGAGWRQAFRRKVRHWYAGHRRDLPWRRSGDPYRVWVSEVMLQQTQVATVRRYFDRFVESLPTVEALARADEAQVLRLWEGMGYYRRARQLHQAARIVVAEHGGVLPQDAQALRRLPGIGPYTAGAILSFAFDARQPILEANTRRLFSRLLAYRGDPTSADGARLLWAMAEAVLPRRDVGAFNQALMDLGGQVCTPRAPRCPDCPVASLCQARAEGVQAQIPPARRRVAMTDRHEVAVLVRRRGRVLVVRYSVSGRWAGLWDFPRFELEPEGEDGVADQIRRHVALQTGVVVEPGRHLTTIRHGVTRFRIRLDCYEARYVSGPAGSERPAPCRWLTAAQLARYPLHATGRRLSRLAFPGHSEPS